MGPRLRTADLGFVRSGFLESLHVHPGKTGFGILPVSVGAPDRRDFVVHSNSIASVEIAVEGNFLADMVVNRHSCFADLDTAVTGIPNRL